MLRIIVFLAVVGLPTIAEGQGLLNPLRAHVEGFTGSQAKECGVHRLAIVDRSVVTADETMLKQSLLCAAQASAQNRAFWTFKEDRGIDSFIGQGLLGTPAGAVYRFTYDYRPSLSPDYRGRFSATPCVSPVVATRGQEAEFQCK